MSKEFVYNQIVKKLEKCIETTEAHIKLVKKMRWNPRADKKPRSELADNFAVDNIYSRTSNKLIEVRFEEDGTSSSTNNIKFRVNDICQESAKEFGCEHEIDCAHYIIPTQWNAPIPKVIFDEVKKGFPKIAKKRLAHLRRELKSVKSGKFKKMFNAFADATLSFRKEYCDFQKHPFLAGCAYDINSNSFIY